MLCSTLTVIVLGLLAIVCFGLDYFIPVGQEDRLSEQWMKGTTIALLVVSVSVFFLLPFRMFINCYGQICNFVIIEFSRIDIHLRDMCHVIL